MSKLASREAESRQALAKPPVDSLPKRTHTLSEETKPLPAKAGRFLPGHVG
jgi:hypothetical protein